MGPSLGGVIVGFLLLAAVFWPLELRFAAVPRQALWRAGIKTDLAYWIFTPLVTRGLTRGAVIVAVVLLALASGVPLDREHVQAFLADPGRLVRRQPVALQILEVLLLGDFVGYWTHRLFHGRSLWRFHAVHHASKEVDWLSSVRLHPVNDVLSRLAAVVPILLLGFPPTILAGYVPFLSFYAILLHANVNWAFGPFRYVLASPAFHRWHHTSEQEARPKLRRSFPVHRPAVRDVLHAGGPPARALRSRSRGRARGPAGAARLPVPAGGTLLGDVEEA